MLDAEYIKKITVSSSLLASVCWHLCTCWALCFGLKLRSVTVNTNHCTYAYTLSPFLPPLLNSAVIQNIFLFVCWSLSPKKSLQHCKFCYFWCDKCVYIPNDPTNHPNVKFHCACMLYQPAIHQATDLPAGVWIQSAVILFWHTSICMFICLMHAHVYLCICLPLFCFCVGSFSAGF